MKNVLKQSEAEINPKVDNNKIRQQIVWYQIMKSFRLVMIIFSLSYFLGAIWYFFTKYTHDYSIQNMGGQGEGFIPETYYNTYSKGISDYESLIQVTYFSFTTLSTIGYGDFHPKSDLERVISSGIMVIGVIVFSFIMGSFTDIVVTLQAAYEENGDPDRLVQWFKVLSRFNGGKAVDPELRNEIDDFFEFYWQRDRNYARKDESGQRFLSELPQSSITKLYSEFLFKDFLYTFKEYFRFENESYKYNKKNSANSILFKNKFFKIGEDEGYTSFVLQVLTYLEPRKHPADELIQELGTDAYEMLFVEKGTYGVGYIWGSTMVTAKKFGYRTVINDWEIFNQKHSEFWYKSNTELEGYCLRNQNIFDLKEEYPELAQQLHTNINKRYLTVVH